MQDWEFGLLAGGAAGVLYFIGLAAGFGVMRIHRLVASSRVWRTGIRTREKSHV